MNKGELMIVYEVRSDVEHFNAVSDVTVEGVKVQFGGVWLGDDWTDVVLPLVRDDLPDGDFFGVGEGAFGVWAERVDDVQTSLEIAGDLLPIRVVSASGQLRDAWVLNITQAYNCLDRDKMNKGERHGWGFNSRVPESTLFKVSDPIDDGLVKSHVFAHSGYGDEEDSFVWQVATLGLEGLIFEKVWEGEL